MKRTGRPVRRLNPITIRKARPVLRRAFRASGNTPSMTTTTRRLSNDPRLVSLCPVGEASLAARDDPSLFISWDGARRHGYVSFADLDVAGEMATLARYIAGAAKGQRVRYRDGDVTNLRLDNLRLERGYAKGQAPNPRRFGGDL
jgi:hypothetical protein